MRRTTPVASVQAQALDAGERPDAPLAHGLMACRLLIRLAWLAALVLMWFAVVAPSSLSAQAPDVPAAENLGVDCAAGACVVRLATGGTGLSADGVLTWRVAEENLGFLPGGGLELLNDAALQSPWGEIRLLDLELRLTVDREYRLEAARGAAAVEFPTVGSVALFRSLLPVRAAIGYEAGHALEAATFEHVAMNLDPDRHYLYFDLEAGRVMGPRAEPIAQTGLALAPGQEARVLVDPGSGQIYVDGQLMLYSYGQGALLEHIVAGELESFEWSWDALPLRQVLILDAQGFANGFVTDVTGDRAGDGARAPFFRTGGEYSVDAGALGDWLGIEGTPLLIGAGLSFDTEAVLVEARAASSLYPEQFLLATVDAELLVPFEESLRAGRVMVAMGGALPWVGLAGDAHASLSGGLDVDAAATLITDWGEEPVIYAVQGATGPTHLWARTQSGWQNVTGAVTAGYGNVMGRLPSADWSQDWSQLENTWSGAWGSSWSNSWDSSWGDEVHGVWLHAYDAVHNTVSSTLYGDGADTEPRISQTESGWVGEAEAE